MIRYNMRQWNVSCQVSLMIHDSAMMLKWQQPRPSHANWNTGLERMEDCRMLDWKKHRNWKMKILNLAFLIQITLFQNVPWDTSFLKLPLTNSLNFTTLQAEIHVIWLLMVPWYHFLGRVCTHRFYHLVVSVVHLSFVLQFQMSVLQTNIKKKRLKETILSRSSCT